MKKYIFRGIATLMSIALLTPCISSCGSDDDEGPGGGGPGGGGTPAATQWEGINDKGKPEFLTLQKDGTGKIESYNVTTDKVDETTDFTYEREDAKVSRFTIKGEARLLREYAELDKAFLVSEKGHVYNALNHKADIKGSWESEYGFRITFGENGKGQIYDEEEITYQPQSDRRGTFSTNTQTFYYVIIGNQALIYDNGYGNDMRVLLTKVGDKKAAQQFSLTGLWEGFDNKLSPMAIEIQKDGTGTLYSYDLFNDVRNIRDNFSVEQSGDDPLVFALRYEKFEKESFRIDLEKELFSNLHMNPPKSAFSRKADIVGEWEPSENSHYYFLKDGDAFFTNDSRAFRAYTYTIDKEGRRGMIDLGNGTTYYFTIIGKWMAWNSIENEINEKRIMTKK